MAFEPNGPIKPAMQMNKHGDKKMLKALDKPEFAGSLQWLDNRGKGIGKINAFVGPGF